MHLRSSIVRVCRANYFMKFDVTYAGRRSLKRQGTSGFEPETIRSAVESSTTELYPRASCSMAAPKFKAPLFPDFFSFFSRVSGCSPTSLYYLLLHWWFSGRILGRPGLDSPPMHLRSSIVRVCRANYFMKFDVTYTGRRSLKGRGHPGLNRRPFDLQSKALPLSYIPVQVAPWLLQNSKHPHFPIFFHFFFSR